MKDKEELGRMVQEVIRHLVKTGLVKLDKDALQSIAGEKGPQVRAQLDALMVRDGCWCPNPPGGCHC